MTVERSIVECARNQGGAALDVLIVAVWPHAYRLALSIVRDRGLAEDAAQEACASIARSLHSLQSVDAFPAWSYRIIIGQALAAARRHPRTEALDESKPIGDGIDRSDVLDFHRALELLTPIQRAVILLHYYAGFDSGEIGAAVGISSSTVRFHMMRGRSALRKALHGDRPTTTHEVMSDAH